MDAILKEALGNLALAPVLGWFMWQFQEILKTLVRIVKANTEAMTRVASSTESFEHAMRENSEILKKNRRALQEVAGDTDI